MSETDDQKVCQACADFEPQTWRKSLCKNCFHTLDEHSAEILASEAEQVAKEKSSAKASGKATEASSEKPESKPDVVKSKDAPVPAVKELKPKAEIKDSVPDKDTPAKTGKKKYGLDKSSSKNDGSWSWAKDLGLEYGKSPKTAPQDTTSSIKGSSPVSSTNAQVSSTKLSPQTSAKPSVKPTLILETSSSSTSKTTANTAATTDTTTTSKAKNFASKFESKASALTKTKPPSTPRDIRPGATSVSALTSKLTDTAGDSKTQAKPLSEKLKEPMKPETKSAGKTSEEAKVTETVPTFSKTTTKTKDDIKTSDKKDSKVIIEESKDKKPTASLGKFEGKSSKLAVGSPSKALPFGKDLLRSVKKDPVTKESLTPDAIEEKAVASQAKHEEAVTAKDSSKKRTSLGESTTKMSEDKSSFSTRNISEKGDDAERSQKPAVEAVMSAAILPEVGQSLPTSENNLTVGELCPSLGSEHAKPGSINTSGQAARSTGRISDSKTANSSESEEKIGAARHGEEGSTKCQNKEREEISPTASDVTDSGTSSSVNLEGNSAAAEAEVKHDTAASSLSSSLVSKGATSSSFTSPTAKPTTSTTASADSKSLPFFLSSKSASENKQQDVQDAAAKDSKFVQSSLDKSKDHDNVTDKTDVTESSPSSITSSSPSSSPTSLKTDECADTTREDAEEKTPVDVKDGVEGLNQELRAKEEELSAVTKQLSKMEEQVRVLEEERERLKRASLQTQKEDLEKLLNDLRAQLGKMEEQCSRLEKDNQLLIDKLHVQEASVKRDQECRGKNSDNVDLEEDLEAAEKELEDVKDENKELQRHIMEMRNEMEEMYDHFRENEHDEFRELQKELDITAKNCRILQFKLRKAERRNEQIEQDRVQYEEKLRMLQDQFDSQDAKNHIRALEDELRLAKEVSVRLHDELDVVEDKRNKVLDENRHLTELLEHTDKRQFRLEMEIDKLRDIVADLKQQLKEAKGGSNNNKESTPDRKPPLGAVGKQGSREHDVSVLMKDLYDSMERENDLKDQLKFTEEEAKMMRRRVSEMDEENENLRLQLQKMSEKASKHKKKEKERLKELQEERKQVDAYRTVLSTQTSFVDETGEISTDVILIVGPEGSDIVSGDEVVPVSQRKDSTDEDLMNVMQMRVQLEMLEQELMTSHKKLDEMDLENENLQAEVKFLQERLAEKEATVLLPEPSTPNAYYEDKLREMAQEADELRWKLIEKERELERLSVVQTRYTREHSHKKGEKLKKSKSLEDADVMQADLRKQLEQLQMEVIRYKKTVEELTEQNEELRAENEELKNKTPIPSVHADDAAVENIELRENNRKLEETNRLQAEKIKTLTENLQKLARDTRCYTSIATSPTIPGTLSIPGIPLVGPGTQTARAGLELPNPRDDNSTRDLRAQLHVLEKENEGLRKLMVGLGAVGTESGVSTHARRDLDSKQKFLSISQISPMSETQKKESREESSTRIVGNFPESDGRVDEHSLVKTAELNAGRSSLTATVSEPSTFNISLATMDRGKDAVKPSSSSSSVAATTAKDAEEDRTKDSEDSASVDKDRTAKTTDESMRSILLDYPEGKSKVIISGSESRVELMEKVLEMDEEIGDLLSAMRKKEEESDRLKREVKYLSTQLKQIRDESRRTELELLQELDMMHDKNSVMSNLLDIINERAEAAEEELERRMLEDPAHSPARSTSNVSQVSALSDTSMGSDEVFLTAHVSKEGVITRDWETKLKVRIESLERLLAEERQKVSMAEKKLLLAGVDSVSPSVSDDVKLRIREKELLQDELLKSQRHLHIATDQIQGLKQRLYILEDAHDRLKADYAKLYDEIDVPADKDDASDNKVSDSDKTLDDKVDEPPFVAKRISVVEAPKFRELRKLTEETNGSCEEISKLEEELENYKQKAKELEYRVEEIDDIWRSKSAATDKERDELEKQMNEKIKEFSALEDTMENLKLELSAKDKIIKENDAVLKEKDRELSRFAEIVEDREKEKRKHDQELQNLQTQISQRDSTIRGLNDTIRIRDERLREKDDILFKLNTNIDEINREMKILAEKFTKMSAQLKEKDAEISVLRNQFSSTSVLSRDVPRGCQTDAEKESFRLKETVKKLQGELDKVSGDKRSLESSLEKSRKSLEEAMMMWDKDRHSLQREANILEEKVRLYEAFNTMNKDETIETLKTECQGYFNEKEALVCELSSVKLKQEAGERIHKEQVAKLQAELTEKLRLLKTEVDNSSHMTTEMNRLKRQAEMAYRLQQEQRVLKAEHLAIKVRYETRIDKMSKEHNKMMLSIDKLQKEREMDKQIIQGIQKNLELVKDSYTEELLRSQEDKSTLCRYVKEIEESRVYLDELQKHVRDLRDKTADQDRLRSELINKFATDRTSWEIERANLNSQINQLEEKIFSSSRQQERSKDIQVNMGMAWEKERREQRRLLAEAHTLALDLQEQLRSRDETFAHERKEMLCQMENDRATWIKDKRETERKVLEVEAVNRKLSTLEKRLADVQEKAKKDAEVWQTEKADLLRLAAEARHLHSSDSKKVEYVLSQLIRLRELGTMLTSQPGWDNLEEKPPDRPENVEQSVIDYVKEAVLHINQAADELTNLTNPMTDEDAIKRIYSSEIDLLKDEFSRLHHETDDVVVIADVTTSSTSTTTRIQEESAGLSRRLPNDSTICVTPSQPHSSTFSGDVTKSTSHSNFLSPSRRTEQSESKITPSKSTTQCSTPATSHPHDSSSRLYDRLPSYASGTRSAQTSRATTPEASEHSHGPYALSSRKRGFPEPPPNFVIPHKIVQSQKQLPSATQGYSTTLPSSPKRPVTFTKSLSMDNDLLDSRLHPQLKSISASNTPIYPVTSADITSSFSTPTVITSSADHLLSVSRDFSPTSSSASSSHRDKFSPRTARRKFFENYPGSVPMSPENLGYQSWPERRGVTPALHVRQTSLPDPEEVRREAEEEYDLVSSKLESWGKSSVMKSSTSWDEQMHRKETAQEETFSSTERTHTLATPTSPTDEHQIGSKHTAKEKRKLFKKATSLESTIGSSIAKVGVAAMPPGAPTGFAPSELFAVVKGKLKPVFKKKSADFRSRTPEPCSTSSPLFVQTDVRDVHFPGHAATSLPVPAPHVNVATLGSASQQEAEELVSDIQCERSRDSQRKDVPRGKWRSKSADRAQASVSVHGDVIRAAPGVWQFNETAV